VRTCRPSRATVKTTTFTVRASAEQARRWALVARWLKCRSVASWLEELADDVSIAAVKIGMLANRARVEQHNIGVLDAIGIDVTRTAQNGAYRLRIGDIHLASVSLEINPRTRRICSVIIHRTKGNLRLRRHVDTTQLRHVPRRSALSNRTPVAGASVEILRRGGSE